MKIIVILQIEVRILMSTDICPLFSGKGRILFGEFSSDLRGVSRNIDVDSFGQRVHWPILKKRKIDLQQDCAQHHLYELLDEQRSSLIDIAVTTDALRALQNRESELHDSQATLALLQELSRLMELAREKITNLNRYEHDGRMAYTNLFDCRLESSPNMILYAGFLGTWRRKSSRPMLSLLVAMRDDKAMESISKFDEYALNEGMGFLRNRLEARELMVGLPPIFIAARPILRAGEAIIPPLHFAYFFPEDMPTKEKLPETVLFLTTSYETRVSRVTDGIRLKYIVNSPGLRYVSSYETQLLWFRAHDISHAIATKKTNWKAIEKHFGSEYVSILGEVLADVFGYLLVESYEAKNNEIEFEFEYGFVAEMLGYLSRDLLAFYDSAAAYIEMSFLLDGGFIRIDGGRLVWQPGDISAGIYQLAKILHQSVLTGNLEAVDSLVNKWSFNSVTAHFSGGLDAFIDLLYAELN